MAQETNLNFESKKTEKFFVKRIVKKTQHKKKVSFTLKHLSPPPIPGKKRSIFTIFVKRPTLAPSLAMRAARAMTTSGSSTKVPQWTDRGKLENCGKVQNKKKPSALQASDLVAHISGTLDQGLDANVTHIQQQRSAAQNVHVKEKRPHIGPSTSDALNHEFKDKHQED